MRANVHASAQHLRQGSQILEALVRAGRVVVVEGDYELETRGRVQLFDRLALTAGRAQENSWTEGSSA